MSVDSRVSSSSLQDPLFELPNSKEEQCLPPSKIGVDAFLGNKALSLVEMVRRGIISDEQASDVGMIMDIMARASELAEQAERSKIRHETRDRLRKQSGKASTLSDALILGTFNIEVDPDLGRSLELIWVKYALRQYNARGTETSSGSGRVADNPKWWTELSSPQDRAAGPSAQ